MRRLVSYLLVVVLLIMVSTAFNNQKAKVSTTEKGNKREYIIIADRQELREVLTVNPNIVIETENHYGANIYLAKLTESETDKIQKSTPNRILVEEDKVVKACGREIHIDKNRKKVQSLISKAYDWNKKMIRTKKLKKSKREKNVKIAILDSGVDYGNDIDLEYSVNLVPERKDCNPLFMDNSGHGNSVAGLIAAKDNEEGITGINPNAKIYSIAVLDENNRAPISRIIEGIYLAIEQKVDIINMSFGMDEYSPALEQAVLDAKQAGILMIAAAGNTGDNVQYPAAFKDVLSVGSVDHEGNISSTSARGKGIDVVAPGELVMSTGELGDVIVSSGTSLAAPQVAAEASLILEKNKNLEVEEIRECIKETSNQCGEKKGYGNGIIDIEYALESADKFESYGKNEKVIEENEDKIYTFQDTGCVEGSWMKEGHEKLIPSGKTYVKKGAVFSDKAKKFDKASENPWWHGSGFFKGNNYVSAVIYNTRLADAYGISKNLDTVEIPYKFSACAKEMRADLRSITNWKAILGAEVTSGRKRAFIWGMAMHNLADVFAHDAYVKRNGKWVHLNHEIKFSKRGIPDADDTKVEETRFKAAKSAVDYALQIYDRKGKITDGVFSARLSSKFKLYKFYTFLAEYNKGNKAAVKSYLPYSIKD